MQPGIEVSVFPFEDSGEIPNHRTLPLVIMRQAVELAGQDPATVFERLYPKGGWHAAWRWGVYDFSHYHSTAHEVLGCYRGSARLRFGHTTGTTVEMTPGDVVVIPAGVGHESMGSSDDFNVVGGYPQGQVADLLRGEPGERPGADDNIARVALPAGDPIFGSTGPLWEHWRL